MTQAADGALVFRPSNEDDLAFIQDSWGSSFYKGCKSHKNISPEDFHSFHRPIRTRFLSKPTACVIVCHGLDDPWLILGWIAVEVIPSGLILQYLYVRKTMKKEGIAAELIKRALPSSPVFFTHLTDRASKIIAKHPDKFQGFKYVPQLV